MYITLFVHIEYIHISLCFTAYNSCGVSRKLKADESDRASTYCLSLPYYTTIPNYMATLQISSSCGADPLLSFESQTSM
jgi:hypothetical protein